jgi:F0F1-type ATP synthase membrane subunit b/b'
VLMAAAVEATAGGVEIASFAPALVPLATIVVGLLAFIGGKRANRVEESQQQARNRIDERVQVLAELQAVNQGLVTENTRLRGNAATDADRNRDDRGRSDADCRRQIETLVGAIETLRTVVLDEVAKSAALGTVSAARQHLEKHDQTVPDGAP